MSLLLIVRGNIVKDMTNKVYPKNNQKDNHDDPDNKRVKKENINKHLHPNHFRLKMYLVSKILEKL